MEVTTTKKLWYVRRCTKKRPNPQKGPTVFGHFAGVLSERSAAGVDVALFGHDEGADQIGPKAHAGAEKGDDPAHPHQGGVNVKILRDAAAHTAQHLVRAFRPI